MMHNESIDTSLYRFDINNEHFYEFGKPKGRTRGRLLEIANCGMEQVGIGEFGVKGVMSGLYLEKVWGYSDSDFKEYMDWAKELINKSEKLTEDQINNLKYFWEEKGDIERYCDFEKLKPQIQQQLPELINAWNNYKASIKTMDAIIKSI